MVLLLAALLAPSASAGGIPLKSLQVLVARLTWGPQPFSDGDVDAAMRSVADFYSTASLGQLNVAYQRTPWLNVLSNAPPCLQPADVLALPSLLTSKTEQAGYDVASYDRVVFVLPSASCAFLGIYNSAGITLNGTVNAGVVIHEIGHSLGMGHAGEFDCRYTPRRFCLAVNSGDIWDVMGAGGDIEIGGQPIGDFGALQKARAGWITSYRCVTKPGTYGLASLERDTTTAQALVVQNGPFEYWIDHREPTGNDAYLATNSRKDVTTGFEVHRFRGNPFTIPPGQVPPDYLMPIGKTNRAFTPPGSTFTVPNVFSATALSRKAGLMTVRIRWLGHAKPATCAFG